jgi:hypothetical protein
MSNTQTSDLTPMLRELLDENKRLREIIQGMERNFNDMEDIAREAMSLSDVQALKVDIKNISHEYIANCLLMKAKVKKDKRAAMHLLRMIKSCITQKKPITGALADYLISAIDSVLNDSKSIDVKKAFLLNGSKSRNREIREVGLAVEAALNEGFKKHKDVNGAYWKVAHDLNKSASQVEKLYSEYINPKPHPRHDALLSQEIEKLEKKLDTITKKVESLAAYGLAKAFPPLFPSNDAQQ